jgi:hypothetical protein
LAVIWLSLRESLILRQFGPRKKYSYHIHWG